MAKRIAFSKKAELDLERITDFNNSRNKSKIYSQKLFLKLTQRLKLLLTQPLSGVETNKENVLLLIWDDYYIFYSYDGYGIIIQSIYHQKENVIR